MNGLRRYLIRIDEVNAEFNSAINENYVDDQTLYSDIKDDIMPDLKELIGITHQLNRKQMM